VDTAVTVAGCVESPVNPVSELEKEFAAETLDAGNTIANKINATCNRKLLFIIKDFSRQMRNENVPPIPAQRMRRLLHGTPRVLKQFAHSLSFEKCQSSIQSTESKSSFAAQAVLGSFPVPKGITKPPSALSGTAAKIRGSAGRTLTPYCGHLTSMKLSCAQGHHDLSRNSFGIFTERFCTNALRKIRVIGLLFVIQNEASLTRGRVKLAVLIALLVKIGTMCEYVIDGWRNAEDC
jgi:hypothetical protein